MSQKSESPKPSSKRLVRDIRRATRRKNLPAQQTLKTAGRGGRVSVPKTYPS
jgi:hypothetical protein